MTENDDKIRFQLELEFVQCLSNPRYLNYLAQKGYFERQDFLNYLQYLTYWKQPRYSRYLMYPQALFFLDQLQTEEFRRELVRPDFVEYLYQQTFYHWNFHKGHAIA